MGTLGRPEDSKREVLSWGCWGALPVPQIFSSAQVPQSSHSQGCYENSFLSNSLLAGCKLRWIEMLLWIEMPAGQPFQSIEWIEMLSSRIAMSSLFHSMKSINSDMLWCMPLQETASFPLFLALSTEVSHRSVDRFQFLRRW